MLAILEALHVFKMNFQGSLTVESDSASAISWVNVSFYQVRRSANGMAVH